MPSSATWMDLEIVIVNEVNQTEILYGIPYTWNLKRNDTNELIYKREIEHMAAKGKNWEKRWLGSLGSTCTHGYILDG